MAKLVDTLTKRIAVLEEALEKCASRFEDIAEVTKEHGGYYNVGFYEISARRCRNVVQHGARFNDEPPHQPDCSER